MIFQKEQFLKWQIKKHLLEGLINMKPNYNFCNTSYHPDQKKLFLKLKKFC